MADYLTGSMQISELILKKHNASLLKNRWRFFVTYFLGDTVPAWQLQGGSSVKAVPSYQKQFKYGRQCVDVQRRTESLGVVGHLSMHDYSPHLQFDAQTPKSEALTIGP